MSFKRYEGIDNPNDLFAQQKKKTTVPYVSVTLAIINVLVFALAERFGDTLDANYMVSIGALYPPCIEQGHEYYRCISAFFLHFGFQHLLNNMFMLVIVGNFVEKALGVWRYLLVYLVSGLGGTLGTYFIRQWNRTSDDSVIAGASGCVFGLLGALLFVAVYTKGKFENLKGLKLLMMLCLTLVLGFTEGNVDIFGHIFGMIAGFLVSIPLVCTSHRLKEVKAEGREY